MFITASGAPSGLSAIFLADGSNLPVYAAVRTSSEAFGSRDEALSVTGSTFRPMSAVSDFLTQPGFWWGVPAGAVLSGVITSVVTARSVRRSDERKALQEDKVLDRKEEREDQRRNEDLVFEAATEFATVCSDILMKSVDVEGVINFLRDALNSEAGIPDPKAMEKPAFAQMRVEEAKGITTPFSKLKMVASPALLAAASRLSTSILALNQTTTQLFARQVAMKTAGDELDNFINVFRAECGREQYPPSAAQRDAMSFMATLKQQVDRFVEDAKRDLRSAGFTTTPWDN